MLPVVLHDEKFTRCLYYAISYIVPKNAIEKLFEKCLKGSTCHCSTNCRVEGDARSSHILCLVLHVESKPVLP